MVMQIPAALPDPNGPLAQRQGVSPLVPVSAVVGVDDVSQALDPRLLMQWATPVFGAESSQRPKNSLETVSGDMGLSLAAAALLELDALPPSDGAVLMGHWLASLAGKVPSPVTWPGHSVADAIGQNKPISLTQSLSDLLTGLTLLYEALAQSPIFAAQKLAMQLPNAASNVAQSTPSAETLQIDEADLQAPSEADEHVTSVWSQALSALQPDSEHAQQAAQCLTTGGMAWSGSLLPGLPAQIRREDAWREHRQAPGQLEKGVSLTLETDLPKLGRLKILAQQWGQDRSITLFVPSGRGHILKSKLPSASDQLKSLGVHHIQIQDLSP